MDSGAIKTNPKIGLFFLVAMVFIGSFLLFWMEPLIGRMLTPRFGGAVHVWLVCLMFFQGMLLLGYLYAHRLANKLGKYHLLLLLLPLINLPLNIQTESDFSNPLLLVVTILILNTALPFIVLSTTAVVAQSWLARSLAGRIYEPYFLYAASNAGALLALIGYTFLAEPLLELRTLRFAWTWIYGIYALFVAGAWFLLRPKEQEERILPDRKEEGEQPKGDRSAYVLWLILSSLPSALLLAVTNLVTLEIGSFPLTWIVPLALYLASFIVAFRTRGGAPKWLKRFWPELILLAFLCYATTSSSWLVLIGVLATFFLICILSHGYLYEIRPPANLLTKYYLLIALGGWIGGAFISLVAPLVFLGLFEYPILLAMFAVAFWDRRGEGSLLFWPRNFRIGKAVRILVMVVLIFFIAKDSWTNFQNMVMFRHRNFYGTYRVTDIPIKLDGAPSTMRLLFHGMTLHGAQVLDPKFGLSPILYYSKGGSISDVFATTGSPRNVAVIGLGSGVTAAYMQKEDSITYYELDPDNERIARQFFTFLDECKGKVRVVAGDGRLSLKKEANAIRYDMIFVDAFTGDGIPTNLLTKEALKVYLDHLSDNGIILFHVSNRYYELRPVINAIVQELNLFGIQNVPPKKGTSLKDVTNRVYCVVISKNPSRLEPLVKKGWVLLKRDDLKGKIDPWTDEYINIFAPLIEKMRMEWID